MQKIQPHIPEGGAIEDSNEMTMEQYSKTMKKQLAREYDKFAENICSLIKPVKNAQVLEIGPGPGWAGIRFVQKRTDVILHGLEASADMVRVAAENAKEEGVGKKCEYIRGEVENMHELKDATYDLAISRDSLHHWIEPEQAFREIKRVLKPEGKLFIHDSRRDMNYFGKMIVNTFSLILPFNMGKYWKSSIAASYTPQEIETMLTNSGCTSWSVTGDLMGINIRRN